MTSCSLGGIMRCWPCLPRETGSPGGTRTRSALAALHPRVLLVDHVDAPAPTHHAAILVAGLRGLQAVANSHGGASWRAALDRGGGRACQACATRGSRTS